MGMPTVLNGYVSGKLALYADEVKMFTIFKDKNNDLTLLYMDCDGIDRYITCKNFDTITASGEFIYEHIQTN